MQNKKYRILSFLLLLFVLFSFGGLTLAATSEDSGYAAFAAIHELHDHLYAHVHELHHHLMEILHSDTHD